MKLSIIIVSYNVCSFLEQCIRSIVRSQGIDYLNDLEVWVVDNASIDNSVSMLRECFPWVKCIENNDNEGFSKANNKAIARSSGKYVLLLNPDTVLEETTLTLCLNFMEEHSDAGGLGVKMLDGKGKFLPESKRGLPTPQVSFYKIMGLTRLFPRSAKFAKYYMGNLDNDKTNKIEVLSGAFMLIPKAVLQQTGYLDESFFMYGEDIDLSYRITQAGYNNYYYPKARIIHYKGESTKKGSLNYVKVFYKAMEIFVEKYFKDSMGGTYSLLLKYAIWLRASMSYTWRIIKKIFLPASDLILTYLIFYSLSLIWESFYFGNPNYYEDFFQNVVLWIYSTILVLASFVCRAYTNPVQIKKIFYGFSVGLFALFALFALLGPQWHYSRFIMIGGSLISFISACFSRYIYNAIFSNLFVFGNTVHRKYLLVGENIELEKAEKWLCSKGTAKDRIYKAQWPLDEIKLRETIRIYRVSEVIFCSEDIPFSEMVSWMRCVKDCEAEFCSFSDVSGKISGS